MILNVISTISPGFHPDPSRPPPGPLPTISALPLPAGAVSAAVQSQFIYADEISDTDLIRRSRLDDHVHSTENRSSPS